MKKNNIVVLEKLTKCKSFILEKCNKDFIVIISI